MHPVKLHGTLAQTQEVTQGSILMMSLFLSGLMISILIMLKTTVYSIMKTPLILNLNPIKKAGRNRKN